MSIVFGGVAGIEMHVDIDIELARQLKTRRIWPAWSVS